MNLTLYRTIFTSETTIGKLYEDDVFICDTLEDRDRGLRQEWELATILSKKIPGRTAIPYGRYEIDITKSIRFKRALPVLLDVPGFEGVRMHAGNSHYDTDGCILTGETVSEIFIKNSRRTFNRVFKLIGDALVNEKVYITIVRI